ncbi:MAG: hypothetical protein GY862_26765 [Gammaproteobacteria bacterium]|nr:hypothetical protein [Gammaproteobacteria bacterium]
MLTAAAAMPADKIKAFLLHQDRQMSVRRVLPRSVMMSLHKRAFAQTMDLSATHKAIQTYTTLPMLSGEEAGLLNMLFGVKELSPEAVKSAMEKTGLAETEIELLRTVLSGPLKQQMAPGINTLLQIAGASSRELPELFLAHTYKMVAEDIKRQAPKIDKEVNELLTAIKRGHVLQTGIMLDVIRASEQPVCLLNNIEYDISERHQRKFFKCHVLLHARKVYEDKKLSNIAVWAELHPCQPEKAKYILEEHKKSEVKHVQYPDGIALFQFADTAVQAELSSPEGSDSLLDAKPVKQVLEEMTRFVRTMSGPKKKKPGIALQVSFAQCSDGRQVKHEDIWKAGY